MADNTFEAITHYSKTDNRKLKQYAKHCTVNVYCPHPDGISCCSGYGYLAFREQIAKDLPDFAVTSSYNNCNPGLAVRREVVMPADRPSLIPSNNTARALIRWSDEELIAKVKAAYEAARQIADQARLKAEIDHNVSRLLKWYLTSVETKSKDVVRFKQRLEALKAELQAEIEVQASKMVDEAMKELAEARADHPEFTDAVVDTFKNCAADFVQKHHGDGMPHDLFHSGEQLAEDYMKAR